MDERAKMLLRSAQVRMPWLQPAKERLQESARRAARRPHERDFRALRLLDVEAGDLVLDVGANLGQSIDSVHRMWPSATLWAFEPNPWLAARLRRRPRAEAVLQYALGRAAGTAELYVPEYNGWIFHGLASLDRGEAERWLETRLLRYDPDRLVVHEVTVDVRPLDEAVPDARPRLIKIDTQGTEEDVIAGGLATIARARPILLIECGRFRGALRTMLEPVGYEPYVFADGSLRRGDQGALNTFFIADRL